MLAPPKPPANEKLELLIKEARERQLRRRLLGAVGIAIAAAIGLSTYALTLGGNAGDVAQEHSGGPLVAASLCRASQLSTSAFFGAATGSDLGGATITNTSGTACTLPNGRPVVLIRWRGRELPARQELPPKSWGDRAVHVLAPNGRAIVRMQWFEWCGAPGETTVFRPTFL